MFSGLKERLQQRKIDCSGATAKTTSSQSVTAPLAAVPPPTSVDDPYVLAIQSALLNSKRQPVLSTNQGSKEKASCQSIEGATIDEKDTSGGATSEPEAKAVQRSDSRNIAKRSRTRSPKGDAVCHTCAPALSLLSAQRLQTEDEIEAQRHFAEQTLSMCICAASSFWKAEQVSCRDVCEKEFLARWGLPKCLEMYLNRIFLEGDGSAGARAHHDLSVQDEEFALLKTIREEFNTTPHVKDAISHEDIVTPEKNLKEKEGDAVPKEIAWHLQLGRLIHVIWFLIAVQWRHALFGGLSRQDLTENQGLSSTGWCYSVYLLANHMLPEALIHTSGSEVALQLEGWRRGQRTRRGAMELLALLLKDYRMLRIANVASPRNHVGHTLPRSGETACPSLSRASMIPSSPKSLDASFSVPLELRQRLAKMLVQHVQMEGNFIAARQAYTDMTMGTANWKIGLFSAGEVHMRRSIERIERNRISHVLNNEHAMMMLHSMRELMSHAEKNLDPTERILFFSCKV